MSSCKTLAFEIGTEEIPAFDLHNATAQLQKMVPEKLDAKRIPHGDIHVYNSPRRLIVLVDDVAVQTDALEEEFRGPAARIAFDEAGNPTKAAIGFARGKGLAVDDLERRDENGTEYVFAKRSTPAMDVAQLLPDIFLALIRELAWPRSMRWACQRETFVRPVRWIVALLGSDVVPFEFAGVCSGNTTRGHRYLAPGPHEVSSADELLQVVRGAYVVPSEEEREAKIREGVAAAESQTKATAELPAKTLLEVVNLCEYPTAIVCKFDEEFLQVPEEIIVDAMLMHQRYFPLYIDGKLTNNFIVVTNGDPDCAQTIGNGNERVVRARLSDAKFFYEEDLKRPLESYVENLDQVVFQEQLGTNKDKTNRIVKIATHLAADASLTDQDAADARRAALLCKADLVTNAVIEFTSVQGVMGRYYAAASGETEQVATAIGDHYKPRFSGDVVPESEVGRVVATADKLDTICGLFAVGQGPTGSSDPFALRRSALGILAMLRGQGAKPLSISLASAIDVALDAYAEQGISFDKAQVRKQVIDFFITRACVMLRDEGCEADTIDAVLAVSVEEPVELAKRVRALEQARSNDPDTFNDLATAYARANNLRDKTLGTDVDASLLSEPEQSLYNATTEAQKELNASMAQNDYAGALQSLAQLRSPIDTFFDEVMVMADDVSLRENRLRLLNCFVDVFANVADFGKMAKAK